MKIAKKIFFEVAKNLKLIFRNLSSLILIVIAPLLLILLVGYSLSGSAIHDIKIGIITDSDIDLSELTKDISEIGSSIEYANVDQCIEDLKLQRTHLCLELRGNFSTDEGNIPNGFVEYYYDNTRKKISLALLSEIKEYFGLTSEMISISSAQKIFDNLQTLLLFLDQQIDDIGNIKSEAVNIREDLLLRKQELIKIKTQYEPSYLLIKQNQVIIEEYHIRYENNSQSILKNLDEITVLSEGILQSSIRNLTNLTGYEFGSIIVLKNKINETRWLMNETDAEINNMLDTVDDTIVQLDLIYMFINDEINRTDNYVKIIDESIVNIDKITAEAKNRTKDFSAIDASLAGKIIKPITQGFNTLLPNKTDIQLTFPLLITTITMFIALLFSNIISLLEIYNKAYTRNILAPVNDAVFTTGLGITNLIIVTFQTAILLMIGQVIFGLDIASYLIPVSIAIVMISLIFICLGMTIAYLTSNMQNSILISTFSALTFFLLSDALSPVEAMPKIAAMIAKFNPVIITTKILSSTIFYNIKMHQMASLFWIMFCYLIAAIVILVLASKYKNRRRV